MNDNGNGGNTDGKAGRVNNQSVYKFQNNNASGQQTSTHQTSGHHAGAHQTSGHIDQGSNRQNILDRQPGNRESISRNNDTSRSSIMSHPGNSANLGSNRFGQNSVRNDVKSVHDTSSVKRFQETDLTHSNNQSSVNDNTQPIGHQNFNQPHGHHSLGLGNSISQNAINQINQAGLVLAHLSSNLSSSRMDLHGYITKPPQASPGLQGVLQGIQSSHGGGQPNPVNYGVGAQAPPLQFQPHVSHQFLHQHSQQQVYPPPENFHERNYGSGQGSIQNQPPNTQQSNQHQFSIQQTSRKRTHSGSQPLTSSNLRSAIVYPRKRALTACDACRLKKVKCDNIRPICGSCVKNGLSFCQYRNDDTRKDYSSYDPASLAILTKLDSLARDVLEIKQNGSIKNMKKGIKDSVIQEPVMQHDKPIPSFGSSSNDFVWELSISSVFRWRGLEDLLRISPLETNSNIKRLLHEYKRNQPPVLKNVSLEQKQFIYSKLEELLENKLPVLINAFFLNSHKKIPVLDVLEIMEGIEVYKIMKSYDTSFNFIRLLQLFNIEELTIGENTQIKVPSEFLNALAVVGVPDKPYRRRAFVTLIKIIPNIVLMCAIGAISTTVQFGNMEMFENSIKERESFNIGCLDESDIPAGLPKSRYQIAHLLSEYSQVLSMMYPFTTVGSLKLVEYSLLKSQYELYLLSPLTAQKSMNEACHHMMYFLQANKKNFDNTTPIYDIPEVKKIRANLLFWCCLKLDSELQSELAPNTPLSGITFIEPPALFPEIPQRKHEEHSEAALQLAKKYEDTNSWYYYLTEVAVRQIDNNLFNEVFKALRGDLWDSPEFSETSIWKFAIKYFNNYNGVINSLNPRIREFVSSQVDAEQVYARLKKRFDEKDALNHSDILDQLEAFLIDDDLLLRAQSESIIYIKTRIIASKLHLFRPLVYLVVHDKVPLIELITAAISAYNEMELQNNTPEDPISLCDSSSAYSSKSKQDQEFPQKLALPFYQKTHPEEDFSELIEENADKLDFKVKDYGSARSKIMKLFFINMINFPKLSVPKLASHRHPGSWYFFRNVFIANIYQVLLYKKFKEYIKLVSTDEQVKQFIGQFTNVPPLELINEMFSKIASKEIIEAMLQHSLFVFKYWQEEATDCKIYIEYCEKMLAVL